MDTSREELARRLAWWLWESVRWLVLAIACAGMLALSYRTIFGAFNAL